MDTLSLSHALCLYPLAIGLRTLDGGWSDHLAWVPLDGVLSLLGSREGRGPVWGCVFGICLSLTRARARDRDLPGK